MPEFEGQVALVTGASRGIGRCVAEDLAHKGAHVIVTARTGDAIVELAGQIESDGGKATAIEMDVSQAESVGEALTSAFDLSGKIDILINNAGITRDGLLMRMKEDDWKSVLATNLDGVYHVTRRVLPRMIRQRFGRVVNIASVVGQMGNAGQCNYVASKAGLIGLTKALAREVASRNITVNAIAPGLIETDMTSGMSDKATDTMLQSIPLGRVGTVEDVAAGVCFLASRGAGYITGQVLGINGGMYM